MILCNSDLIEYFITQLASLVESFSSCVHNHQLKKLAWPLPMILKPCRTERTNKKYTLKGGASSSKKENIYQQKTEKVARTARRRKIFTSKRTPHYVVLGQPVLTGIIELCYYAIQYFHKLDLARKIFLSNLCEDIADVVKRNRKRAKVKKESITVNNLQNSFIYIVEDMSPLLDLEFGTEFRRILEAQWSSGVTSMRSRFLENLSRIVKRHLPRWSLVINN